MALNPEFADFSFVDAQGFAQEIFEVVFSSWGVRVIDANPVIALANLQFPLVGAPGIPASVAAIAIGPRSTVDRCWSSYFRQKPFNNSFLSIDGLTRRVSLGSPLVWPQAAQGGGVSIGTTNDPENACHLGAFYVFPKARNQGITAATLQSNPAITTMTPLQYVSGVDGTTLLPWGNSVGNHEDPTLHLYLYLKPLRQLPGPRFPMQRSFTGVVAAAGSPHCIGQLPIFGRSRIRLAYTSTASTAVTLGLLRGLNETPTNNLEVIAATDTHTHGTLSIDNPCADYLNIYASPDADATVTYAMTALDDVGFT